MTLMLHWAYYGRQGNRLKIKYPIEINQSHEPKKCTSVSFFVIELNRKERFCIRAAESLEKKSSISVHNN